MTECNTGAEKGPQGQATWRPGHEDAGREETRPGPAKVTRSSGTVTKAGAGGQRVGPMGGSHL